MATHLRTEILFSKCHLKCSTNVILTLVTVHSHKTRTRYFMKSVGESRRRV